MSASTSRKRTGGPPTASPRRGPGSLRVLQSSPNPALRRVAPTDFRFRLWPCAPLLGGLGDPPTRRLVVLEAAQPMLAAGARPVAHEL